MEFTASDKFRAPVNPEHSPNAYVPMTATESGIVRVPVRPVQVLKVLSLIVPRLAAIRSLVNPEQPSNADSYTAVMVPGIVRVPVSPEHPLNAPASMTDMLLGIVRVPVSPEHPSNRCSYTD